MKVNLIENKEHKGIELYFESYPYAASRNILKGAGFKWHNSKKCWYAVENPDRRSIAEKVMKREKDHRPYIPEPVKPEKVTEAPEVKPEPEKVYKYGMRLRGFSIGCQPKDGFIERSDDASGRYYDIISYNRPLTSEETDHFSLDYIPEVVKPEEVTPEPVKVAEPEKVSSLGVKVEKVKKGKRSDLQRAFDYIIKLAPDHMKNGAPDQWNGNAGDLTICCDGHQIFLTSDNIDTDLTTSEDRISRLKKDFFIKTSEEAINRAELDFTAKELKQAITQLKKGKRKAQVVYTFENGLTLNADYLYNMMLATGQTTLFYKDMKSPVYMEAEKTSYILLPINNRNGAATKGLYVINQ